MMSRYLLIELRATLLLGQVDVAEDLAPHEDGRAEK
jgi:hypothetical protein